MIDNFMRQKWDKQAAKYADIRAQGRCLIIIKGRRLQVVCPYTPEFVAKARELSGTWRDRTGIWSFRVQAFKLVRATLSQIFGEASIYTGGDYHG